MMMSLFGIDSSAATASRATTSCSRSKSSMVLLVFAFISADLLVEAVQPLVRTTSTSYLQATLAGEAVPTVKQEQQEPELQEAVKQEQQEPELEEEQEQQEQNIGKAAKEEEQRTIASRSTRSRVLRFAEFDPEKDVYRYEVEKPEEIEHLQVELQEENDEVEEEGEIEQGLEENAAPGPAVAVHQQKNDDAQQKKVVPPQLFRSGLKRQGMSGDACLKLKEEREAAFAEAEKMAREASERSKKSILKPESPESLLLNKNRPPGPSSTSSNTRNTNSAQAHQLQKQIGSRQQAALHIKAPRMAGFSQLQRTKAYDPNRMSPAEQAEYDYQRMRVKAYWKRMAERKNTPYTLRLGDSTIELNHNSRNRMRKAAVQLVEQHQAEVEPDENEETEDEDHDEAGKDEAEVDVEAAKEHEGVDEEVHEEDPDSGKFEVRTYNDPDEDELAAEDHDEHDERQEERHQLAKQQIVRRYMDKLKNGEVDTNEHSTYTRPEPADLFDVLDDPEYVALRWAAEQGGDVGDEGRVLRLLSTFNDEETEFLEDAEEFRYLQKWLNDLKIEDVQKREEKYEKMLLELQASSRRGPEEGDDEEMREMEKEVDHTMSEDSGDESESVLSDAPSTESTAAPSSIGAQERVFSKENDNIQELLSSMLQEKETGQLQLLRMLNRAHNRSTLSYVVGVNGRRLRPRW